MTPATDMPKNIHHGRNVKRFREMMGLKQEALADQLGGDWTQKKISYLEAKETIEPDLLNDLAKALKVPAEAIQNFDEEKVIYNIQNNYEGSNNHGAINLNNHQCTFNPLDKYVEAVEKNEKLYEALLKSEREKIVLLERLLNERK
jgi:transcriptional regulator with XRE-family HTH domain